MDNVQRTEISQQEDRTSRQRSLAQKHETAPGGDDREKPRQTGEQVSDMLSQLLFLCAAGQIWGYAHSRDGQVSAAPPCPSPCQCEQDGIFIMVDCSELGLSSVPTNFSPLTTYL